MPKGIEIKDLTTGTGDEATKESIVAANVRMFLRRGDEVSPSPEFGTRRVIDLGRRDCIAGLRYGIPGMRVGGTREIVISPHLAYGKAGIPDRIPANALLRCEVDLLELREFNALLPQDWLPGKILMLRNIPDVSDQLPDWHFTAHEGGNSRLTFRPIISDKLQNQERWIQVAIPLGAGESAELIRQATDLPLQIQEVCIDWNSGRIDSQKSGTVIKNKRDGARYMSIHIKENGKDVCLMGVHQDSPAFRNSSFYKTIERLIKPHLSAAPEST
jgi:hypothetical protein